MNERSKRRAEVSGPRLPLGLDGLFRGLSQVLQIADAIASKAPEDASTAVEVTETGRTGPKGLRAVYGATVHIGPRVAPARRHLATLRRNARKEAIIDEERAPAADVHDEGDHYLVVADLAGADESTVQWHLRDPHRLILRAEAADRKYSTEIELAEAVQADTAVGSHANGVLELRLWKTLR